VIINCQLKSREILIVTYYLLEVAYVLRRAELNDRQPNPWSIRQTGIYHKITYSGDSEEQPTSTFILVSPSPVVEEQMHMYLQRGCPDHDKLKPSNLVHQILVADSLSGWMDYTAWLEKQYRKMVNKMLISFTFDPSLFDERRIYQLFAVQSHNHLGCSSHRSRPVT
jgi:hypothetical protein